jgi:hypothetical protein
MVWLCLFLTGLAFGADELHYDSQTKSIFTSWERLVKSADNSEVLLVGLFHVAPPEYFEDIGRLLDETAKAAPDGRAAKIWSETLNEPKSENRFCFRKGQFERFAEWVENGLTEAKGASLGLERFEILLREGIVEKSKGPCFYDTVSIEDASFVRDYAFGWALQSQALVFPAGVPEVAESHQYPDAFMVLVKEFSSYLRWMQTEEGKSLPAPLEARVKGMKFFQEVEYRNGLLLGKLKGIRDTLALVPWGQAHIPGIRLGLVEDGYESKGSGRIRIVDCDDRTERARQEKGNNGFYRALCSQFEE